MLMKIMSKRSIFATIVALLLASLSIMSAFAAPSKASKASTNLPKSTNTSLAKMWGSQYRDFLFDQEWFNHFRSEPGKIKNTADRAKIEQYITRYTVALRQAGAIIRGGINAKVLANTSSSQASTTSTSSSTSGQSNTSSTQTTSQKREKLTPQEQLALDLHLMSGLRDKILDMGINTVGMHRR